MERSSPLRILVAEDDVKTAHLIETYLRNESFDSVLAFDGPSAIANFSSCAPSLVILDVMVPKLDGFRVCEEIRKTSKVPILFLTARDDESDRVLGFDLGADDYVVKPFSPRELIARVKALLRRSQDQDATKTSTAPSGSMVGETRLRHDADKRRFSLGGEYLSLTPAEFTLLQCLIAHPGKVFRRDELLDKLYPNGELVIDRVIDVHIGKLRQKIGDDPNAPTFIHTVRGIGYRFSDVSEEC